MCGPSSQETGIAGQSTSLSSLLSANYAQRFGEQTGVINMLRDVFTPIAEAGPDQQGFGPQELAALKTQATEGVGATYAKGKVALQNTLAARGGGNMVLPTGAEGELQGNLLQAAAAQQSQEDLAITRANYSQGRQNFLEATGGLQGVASRYSPEGYAGAAEKGFESSFGMAKDINQQRNQATADIIGGVTSLAKGAATGGLDFANSSDFLGGIGGGKIFGSGGIFGGG